VLPFFVGYTMQQNLTTRLLVQQISINPDLRQNRIKLVVRIISNVSLYKNIGLSGFFKPPIPNFFIHQFRIKSAFFPSRNPDFSALTRCCVLKCTDWSQRKIRQLSDAIQECAQHSTDRTARNIRLIVQTIISSHKGIAYHVEYHSIAPRFQFIDQC